MRQIVRHVLQRPLQVWLPQIQGGLVHPARRRDRDRAYRAWQGEHVVWLGPDYEETTHWRQDGARCMAIRGEEWEAFYVNHVGENGAVFGPGAARFPNRSVNGILDTWLNLPPGSVRFAPGRNELTVPVPCREGDNIVSRAISLPLTPGSLLPIAGADEERQIALLRWPPDPSDPLPVSPEEESAERYRLSSVVSEGSGPAAASGSDRPAATAMPLRIVWPDQVAGLFPCISSLDELYAHDLMRAVVVDQAENPEAALRRAQDESRDWLSDGHPSVADTWLNPIIAKEGEEAALIGLESRYNICAASLEEAYADPRCQQEFRRLVPVRRAYGVSGLMWALLLDNLERGFSFRTCGRCGRIISGRSHKGHCSKEESPDSFRQRRAEDRRRERRRPS